LHPPSASSPEKFQPGSSQSALLEHLVAVSLAHERNSRNSPQVVPRLPEPISPTFSTCRGWLIICGFTPGNFMLSGAHRSATTPRTLPSTTAILTDSENFVVNYFDGVLGKVLDVVIRCDSRQSSRFS
jgi:hypothetical protein